MSILLVGCGYWGQNWAKTLNQLGELGAICEPSAHLRASLQEKFVHIPIESELTSALALPNIEAVVIVTPVITHRDIAAQCLLAGKHVLVEKPITLQANEASELLQLAKATNRVLAVGHLLMYHPALLRLKDMIQQGELGEVRSVQCTRINLGKVRNEENVWWSLAPHDLSIISFLLDEPLEVIQAFKLNPLQRLNIEDSVYASFQTPSGREATIQASWLSPFKKHETIVIGTQKIAIFDDTLPPDQKLSLVSYELDRTDEQIHSITRGEQTYIPYEVGEDLLTREARAFLHASRRQVQTLANDGKNGLLVVKLLEQVQELLNQQNSPKSLSLV